MAEAVSTKSSKDKSAIGLERHPRQPARQAVASGPQGHILALQRSAGNRATSRLWQPSTPRFPGSSHDETEMQAGLLEKMERIFGLPFADIVLRTDEAAASRSESLGAKAYTDGKEIGFGRGQFAPERPEGIHTIAHEFAHVAQARGGTGAGTGSGTVELLSGGSRTKKTESIKDIDIIEANADAAADAVVKGQRPAVLHASLMTVAREDKTRKIKVPPRGSFFVAPLKGGGYLYTFNGEDALSWQNRSLTVFTYYLKDAFPGATDQMAADLAVKLHLKLEGRVPDETIRQEKVMRVEFKDEEHKIITEVMARDYPQIKPARPQIGERSLGQEATSGTIGDQPQPPQKGGEKVTQPGVVKGEGGKEPPLTAEEQKLADQLAELMKGAPSESKVDTKEMVRLFKILKEATKDPRFGETGESFVRFARFIEKNKDKIEGILATGPKGKLTQDKIEKIIAEYEKYIATEPIEPEPGEKLETIEDYEKEFQYDPSWQKLSKADRKLLIEYAKLKPEEIKDEKVDFKRVTTQMKVTMALKLADKSVLGAMADAAEQAFTDPTFIITLVVMMGIYVGLWLTPDPTLITKIAAGTLTVVLLLQFAWEDIIGTARAWFGFEKECGRATNVAQLRASGNKFMAKLGQTGFDILMFIVMWRVGKKVGPKVQKIGAKRGVARAETQLAEAEAKPGSGKTPKATGETANLLNEAKTAAADPANPTSVLDTLAKSLSGEAQTGLATLRRIAGDAQALKAIESQAARGLDIKHFLTEKGLSEAAAKAVAADVQKAKVALARARLIEAETIKDPALREAVRAEQYKALTEVLKDLGILKDTKVQSALNSRNLNTLISAIGEAIARTKLQTKYPASKGYKVLTNLAVAKELKGFKSIAEWRAAEKAKAKVDPSSEAAIRLEKQLSRQAARLFEKDGKVYDAIGEIDIMVTEPVKGGKPRPVEVSEVKTGGTDKAIEATKQIEQSTQGLGQIAANEPGVRLFERTGHNEIGKELTGDFDLSQLSSLKKTTYGLEGKTGFSETLGVAEEVIVGLADSLIKSLPPKGTQPSLPPHPKKEEEK
jgi:hypothetical protein